MYARQRKAESQVQRQGMPDMEAREMRGRTDANQGAKHTGPEKDLQKACEDWLTLRGYRRRAPRQIALQTADGGRWFLHFPRTKGNPIVLDLILFDATRGEYNARYIEIELKVEGGKVSDEQRALYACGAGVVVWSLDEFMAAVKLWERVAK